MDLTGLAIKQALKGEFALACKTNQAILEQEPDNIDALNRLAQAYIQLNQISKAKTTYRQVLKLDRFNPIAKRNLEKLQNLSRSQGCIFSLPNPQVNFLEEPGKTKLTTLVCLGEIKTLAKLSIGQSLKFITKGKVVCLYDDFKEYVGRLPDDLSRRIIWLVGRGNRYAAYIKSAEKQRILVFIKEIRQAKINHNFASFPASKEEATLLFA